MQRDPGAFAGNPFFAYEHEAEDHMAKGPLGGPPQCAYKVSGSPAFGVPVGMTDPQLQNPLGGFEFHPSKICPRNFIIFDHNDDKGRIMYHPVLVDNLNPTNINAFPSHCEVACKSSGQENGHLDEDSSSFKEDTREIDALLSSDEDSEDDDVVSTGRTPNAFESDPLDSSSSPSFKKTRYSSAKNSAFHGSMENVTQEKMRKMVTVLREIIPGGDQLDTPAILEEAVRYLKYLKMEVKKLGVEGLDD